MNRGDSGVAAAPRTRSARRRATILIAQGALAGVAAFALAACGGGSGSGSGHAAAAPKAKTVHVSLIGRVDANSGAPGTYTGKDGWPAYAPSTLHVVKGDTVVLTIKEYDDAPTALPAGSPYHAVQGGAETANGAAVTSVSNSDIAHTFTIPALGINVPLPKAPDGGVTTVVFTFKASQSGDFTWLCMTPCGSGSSGMGGAMAKYDWMKGHLIVS